MDFISPASDAVVPPGDIDLIWSSSQIENGFVVYDLYIDDILVADSLTDTVYTVNYPCGETHNWGVTVRSFCGTGECVYTYIVPGDPPFHTEPCLECSLTIDVDPTDTTICQGDSITLNTTVDGAQGSVDYTWTPDGFIADPSATNPIVFPKSTITYRVVAVDDSGCVDTGYVRVGVTRVIVSAAPDTSVCSGDTVTLMARVLEGIGPYSYAWTPAVWLARPDASATALVCTTVGDFSFYCEVFDSATSCSDIDSVSIHVEACAGCSLTVVAYAADSTLCIGDTTQLFAYDSLAWGDVEYLWTPSASLNENTVQNPLAFPTGYTEYIVQVTDDSGCTAVDTLIIEAIPCGVDCSLEVIAGPDTALCYGDSVELSAMPSGAYGEVSYNWQPVGLVSDPNIANPIASPTASTNFIVRAQDDSGCSALDTTFILVSPEMSAIIVSSTSAEIDTVTFRDSITYCLWDSVSLDGVVTGGFPPYTYTWVNFRGDVICSGPTPYCYERIISFTPDTIYLTVEDTLGCPTVASFSYIVCDTPTAVDFISPEADAVVPPGDIDLIWSSSHVDNGFVVYDLYIDDILVADSLADTVYSVNYPCGETHTWGVTVRSFCGTGECIYTYIVPGDPPFHTEPCSVCSLSVTIAPTDTTVCQGDSVTLNTSLTGAQGSVDYIWYPNIFISDPLAPNPAVFPETTITYRVITRDDSGCVDTGYARVSVTRVVVSAAPDTSVCLGDTITLIATILEGTGPYSYNWAPAEGLARPYAPATAFVCTTLGDFSFSCEVLDSTTLCADIDSIFIYVVRCVDCKLGVQAYAAESTLCIGDTTQLFAEDSLGWGSVDYLWTPDYNLSDPHVQNPLVYPETTSTYRVTVEDDSSCIESDTVRIVVVPCFQIDSCFVHPQPFSPNDDGINEYGKFEYPEMSEDQGVLYIYDMDNKLVREMRNGDDLESDDGTIYWNGADDEGMVADNGIYLYLIKVDGEIVCKGTVYLAK